jgi:hypothetical protein
MKSICAHSELHIKKISVNDFQKIWYISTCLLYLESIQYILYNWCVKEHFFFSLSFKIGLQVFGHIKFEQIWYFSFIVEM